MTNYEFGEIVLVDFPQSDYDDSAITYVWRTS